MSNFDFESFSEGDWEDRGELAWNEFDWQQYLKQNEKEIARFLALYNQHKHLPEHLDHVAHLMGWDDQEWAPADDDAPAKPAVPPAAPAADAAPASPDEIDEDAVDTYTIHKHPVFIATRGLYQHLYLVWEHFMAHGAGSFASPSLAWKFATSLHIGELNAVMAIHALDLGDFALTICHLKNALSAVNHSLSLVQLLPLTNTAHHVQFFREVQTSLFDLREIWLRVMNDCREENRRRTLGEQEERE
jgi:hypothetical protein